MPASQLDGTTASNQHDSAPSPPPLWSTDTAKRLNSSFPSLSLPSKSSSNVQSSRIGQLPACSRWAHASWRTRTVNISPRFVVSTSGWMVETDSLMRDQHVTESRESKCYHSGAVSSTLSLGRSATTMSTIRVSAPISFSFWRGRVVPVQLP